MKQLAIAILFSTALLSCAKRSASGDAVQNEQTAIALGQKNCRGTQSEADFFRTAPRDDWHASLSGDHWDVWFGQRHHGHAFMEVFVAKKDGTATDCGIWVE